VYNNIPAELKALRQWIVYKIEVDEKGKPTKVPYNPHNGYKASPTNPAHWGSFQDAVAVSQHCSGIGFVITANDPYLCIDLDEAPDEETQQRQNAIFAAFDSYSEVSPSGKGCHIWIKASVPGNRNRAKVEMYTAGHYMTFTGNCCRNLPINEYQALATQLWEQMDVKEKITSTIDNPEVNTDSEVLQMAATAANGQKFMDLYDGKWQLHYDDEVTKVSCNEADFALINILAFYTQNRNQITRIFRASALGKRDKAKRQQYLDYMLDRAFDRMPAPLNLDVLHDSLMQQLTVKRQEQIVKETKPEAAHKVNGSQLSQVDTVKAVKHSKPAEYSYTVPPGLVGEIARFIHDAAPRPVPEIAIAGAIGLMSGICGRSYNISGTGLNQYILILAMTGAGKESCASGIDKLITATIKTVPGVSEFVGPGEIASPQALMKYMNKTSNCFMSLVGEFGMKFKQLCSDRASSNDIGLKRIFLDLYNKSGKDSILKPLIYSDKDKNTEPIKSPSFSMLGETTPETFYENLNAALISDGLLPRFTIIEYKGKRPQLNENHLNISPSSQLMDRFSALCAYSLQLNNGNNALEVLIDPEALKMFKDFDKHCDNQINHANSDVNRQLWNRAHIKSLKLAALLAVGVNYIQPVINVECATWALQLITQDVLNLLARFDSGDIGVNNVQNDQAEDIKKVIKKYLLGSWDDAKKYAGCSEILFTLKIIPHSYITACCRQRASFKNDKSGPVQGITNALKSMIDCGEIVELSPLDKKAKNLTDRAKLYVISGMQL